MAVLSARWHSADEGTWALRQVAGALAMSADVHVVTPEGSVRQGGFEGPFTVHRLASATHPARRARRSVLFDALGDTRPVDGDERALAGLLDDGQDQWDPAADLLRALHPDLVVVADARETGASRVSAAHCPGAPVVLVPLARHGARLGHRALDVVFDTAAVALVFSDAEGELVRRDRPAVAVRHVGLPLAANASVQREPNTFTADLRYVLAVTGAPWDAPSWPNTALSLVRPGVEGTPIAIAATDRFVLCHEGEERHTSAVERGTDMLRLMAWAAAVVDVRPGRLYARRTLDALLYGTPVVAPAESRAREHLARGGLWFDGPGELRWCVELLGDPSVRDRLGAQGRRYAEERYCGLYAFSERVTEAVSPALAAAG